MAVPGRQTPVDAINGMPIIQKYLNMPKGRILMEMGPKLATIVNCTHLNPFVNDTSGEGIKPLKKYISKIIDIYNIYMYINKRIRGC